jgi:hypothetical protein
MTCGDRITKIHLFPLVTEAGESALMTMLSDGSSSGIVAGSFPIVLRSKVPNRVSDGNVQPREQSKILPLHEREFWRSVALILRHQGEKAQ